MATPFVLAAESDGIKLWETELGGELHASPALGFDGTIYISGLNSNLYAVNPSGSIRWTFPLGAPTYATPAVGADGTLYIGTDRNDFYAIDHNNGLKWRVQAPGFVESSAVIDTNWPSVINIPSGGPPQQFFKLRTQSSLPPE